MEHRVIVIADGGEFGRRVGYLLEKKGYTAVIQIDTEKYRRKCIVARNLVHKAANAVQRRVYHRDYGIKSPYALPEWNSIREKIKQQMKLVHPEENRAEEEKKVPDKWDILVEIEREYKKGINLDRIYLEMLEWKTLPKRCVIMGSGKRSAEAASILADLGCKVYVIADKEELLWEGDKALRERIKKLLLEKGVLVLITKDADTTTNCTVIEGKRHIEIIEKSKIVERIDSVDLLLVEQKPRMYKEESRIVIRSPEEMPNRALLFTLSEIDSRIQWDPFNVFFSPVFIYTNPPAAYAGMVEEVDGRVKSPKFRGLFYSVCGQKLTTEYKVVIYKKKEGNTEKENVSGMSLFGDDSFDVIKGFAIAMYSGISPECLLKTIPIHPTSSEELITG